MSEHARRYTHPKSCKANKPEPEIKPEVEAEVDAEVKVEAKTEEPVVETLEPEVPPSPKPARKAKRVAVKPKAQPRMPKAAREPPVQRVPEAPMDPYLQALHSLRAKEQYHSSMALQPFFSAYGHRM